MFVCRVRFEMYHGALITALSVGSGITSTTPKSHNRIYRIDYSIVYEYFVLQGKL